MLSAVLKGVLCNEENYSINRNYGVFCADDVTGNRQGRSKWMPLFGFRDDVGQNREGIQDQVRQEDGQDGTQRMPLHGFYVARSR